MATKAKPLMKNIAHTFNFKLLSKRFTTIAENNEIKTYLQRFRKNTFKLYLVILMKYILTKISNSINEEAVPISTLNKGSKSGKSKIKATETITFSVIEKKYAKFLNKCLFSVKS